jgi:hypothetical protein
MKTMLRIFLFSFWAIGIGFWPAGTKAQAGSLGPCAFPSLGNVLGFLSGGGRPALRLSNEPSNACRRPAK